MATGITTITTSAKPYLTTAEYKAAPTAQQVSNLVVGGNEAAQDAELAMVIERASSFIDEYLDQNLVATQRVETQRVRMTPQGYISLHPNCTPLIALVDFNYGSDPNNLISLTDPSTAYFENAQVIIPLSQMGTTYSSQGPLGFGGASPTSQIFTKYTYVAGYANTVMAQANAAATSITVTDGAGFIAGQRFQIIDGAKTETVTIASNYVFGSTTLPLTTGLTYAHLAGATVTNLPMNVKQACILLTTAFIRTRGDSALTMSVTQRPIGQTQGAEIYGSTIKMALSLIASYKRIR